MSTSALVNYTVDLGILITFAGMVLCLVRLLRGPTLADRALAADTIVIHLMAMVLLLTIRAESLLMFDGVIVLALLGFATTIAVAQYLLRRHESSLDHASDQSIGAHQEDQA